MVPQTKTLYPNTIHNYKKKIRQQSLEKGTEHNDIIFLWQKLNILLMIEHESTKSGHKPNRDLKTLFSLRIVGIQLYQNFWKSI